MDQIFVDIRNLRDMEYDKAAGIKTLALLTGYKKGLGVYFFLNISAFLSVIGLVILGILPLWTLIAMIFALPGGIKMLKYGQQTLAGNLKRLQMLEQEAAQFHFKFGTLFTLGIICSVKVVGG